MISCYQYFFNKVKIRTDVDLGKVKEPDYKIHTDVELGKVKSNQ